jgi:Protein of unknown function (DUF402)
MGWAYGDAIVRREVAWGRPWFAVAERVVEDTDGLFVTFVPTGAPFGYGAGPWPTANGLQPWYPKPAWTGHGTLIVQRPGDAYAIQHFWTGDDRRFERWYVNLQAPMRRTAIGYDTDDHELDLVVWADGRRDLKDDEKMEERVREGRYTAAEVVEFRALAADIAAMLDAARAWWDPRYAEWEPDPAWGPITLVDGWERAPVS